MEWLNYKGMDWLNSKGMDQLKMSLTVHTVSIPASLTNLKMYRIQLPETKMIWTCWNLIGKFVKISNLNFFGGFSLRGATVHHHAGRIASAQIQPPTFLSIPIILRQTNEFCPTHQACHTLQLSSFISWQSVCKFFSVFSPERKITFKIVPLRSADEI